jgi:hypothetical protein
MGATVPRTKLQIVCAKKGYRPTGTYRTRTVRSPIRDRGIVRVLGDMKLFRSKTGIVRERNLCLSRIASEQITSRLQESSTVERRSTLPNRDYFMRCVQQPLGRLPADQSSVLPFASDDVLKDALSFWHRMSYNVNVMDGPSDYVREAVSSGHRAIMKLAVQQGHFDVARSVNRFVALGRSCTYCVTVVL